MNLEAALAEQVGPLAGRLHTGRSRNDQVATDLRLWTRRAIDELDAALVAFERALVDLAEREGTAVLPGTTHIQPAQPVLFAHHLLAYVEMAERDRGRLADARARLNVSPLGAGALAGAGYPLDREATAAELGFDGVSANSLDAVSDRDFVVETMAAVALGMVHLSRLAEEITWWSNPRFGFVRVADAFSTGSSMMPNKKNPDPGRARPWPRCPRHRGADRGPDAAQGPAARLPARPPGGHGAAVRRGRGVRDLAAGDGRARRDADRRSRADAAAAGEGYTTATAVADTLVRRGVRVPGRPPHRRRAGRRGRGRGARAGRGLGRGGHGGARRRATMRRRPRWPTNPGSPTSYGRPPRSRARLPRATSSAGLRRRASRRPSRRPGSASTGPDRATSGGNGLMPSMGIKKVDAAQKARNQASSPTSPSSSRSPRRGPDADRAPRRSR